MFNELRQRFIGVVMVSVVAGPWLLMLPSFFLSGCAMVPSAPQVPALTVEDFRVPSDAAGIELFVRNKRPNGMQNFPADRIVLLVHGITFPSESTFDLSLDGLSWMDYIARVVICDIRQGARKLPVAGVSNWPFGDVTKICFRYLRCARREPCDHAGPECSPSMTIVPQSKGAISA